MTLEEAKKQARFISKTFGDTVWVYKSKNMKDTFGTILSLPRPSYMANLGYFKNVGGSATWFDGTAVQL